MKIKLEPDAFVPARAHAEDAGLDLRSRENAIVPAGGNYLFDTGVHVLLPIIEYEELGKDYTAGLLVSKSGLNVNHDITSVGLIDANYTGSIHVKLYNHGTEDYHVKRGDKISQLVIVPVIIPELEIVEELPKTERSENGFGLSGR